MSRRRNHQPPQEEHADETWLVPYSDLLTLLLALFIVLFASAQVDQKKFDQLRHSFNEAFDGNVSFFHNTQMTPSVTEKQTEPTQMTVMAASDAKNQEAYMRETSQLTQVKKMLDQYIQTNKLTGELDTELTSDGLMIRIKDTALFTSGSAALLPDSQRLAATVARMLLPLTQKISISGYTDNVPIHNTEFPSNWDLSTGRALNFMKFLLAQEKNLQPDRFSATGYGEYRPVATNGTAEGRAQNRRVEVLIMRNYKQP
ncbi:membrane motb of proton-channel complex mota/motb [Lucifera butyrica]|uniref:Membrane motb of proton-channel complex mota/motb n=1 Tax=Lucifera butyrica TaxID=1351585 RepID=A0A498R6D5_9FIRM|nr:flagellar motor protein MotB [Lucifera butyrica]VBB05812.1 membrane motb of proton-channel complex mota/motb [Lucifera butyrica]